MLTAFGCEESKHAPASVWPGEAVQGFTTGCIQAGGPPEKCTCMVDALQRTTTWNEFSQFTATVQAGKMPERSVAERVMAARNACGVPLTTPQ